MRNLSAFPVNYRSVVRGAVAVASGALVLTFAAGAPEAVAGQSGGRHATVLADGNTWGSAAQGDGNTWGSASRGDGNTWGVLAEGPGNTWGSAPQGGPGNTWG
ncbi:hypothetical protein ACFYSC_21790 [Streptosporangium sp. NPDC004379]|uniref:hypothetical protein n=1 Tax=Streptosporangium sp. NPDC004379 TaxID=3366189 RepID=UPI00369040B5